jgi:hypothetical protein
MVLMEIARGRGHRLWYGGEYRLAAGYKASQSIVPFDPSQVDTWLYFSWRYAPKERREVFLFARRVCLHYVDRHFNNAVFWTHAAFGAGTVSRAEVGEIPLRVRQENKPLFDAYISAGPFMHGGPSRILGQSPSWQWEVSLFLAYTIPLNRTLLTQTNFRADYLNLAPNYEDQHRYRLYIRQYLIAQRNRGNFSFFIDRNLHDSYIERWHPVSWRFGMEHKF